MIVRVVADRDTRASLMADLQEEFEVQAQDHGSRLARRWYWSQVIRSLPPLAWRRVTRRNVSWRSPRRMTVSSRAGQDLAFALRTLARAPRFTLVIVVTLALGIGANTAVFSMMHSLIVEPLPFEGGDRVVQLWREGQREGERTLDRPGPDMVAAWRREAEAFEVLAGYTEEEFHLTGGDYPLSVGGSRISPGLLTLIGATPLLGRLFVPADAARGMGPVALLSEELWTTRYGADPGVVGRTAVVNDTTVIVVGVVAEPVQRILESGFFGDGARDIFLPLPVDGEGSWSSRPYVMARLRPGISLAAVQAELDLIQSRLPPASSGYRWHPRVSSASTAMPSGVRTGLWVLLGAVGMVLLIACANTANLFLVRNLSRRQEFRLRLALGAGRARLARQLLSESLVLGAAGTALAILTARWLMKAAEWIAGSAIEEVRGVRLDPEVFLFSLGLGLLATILLGLLPLRQAMRAASAPPRARAAGLHDMGRPGWSAHQVLVVSQVALALVLLLGAGLLTSSHRRLLHVDPGIDTEGLVAVGIDLPRARYEDDVGRIAFFEELSSRVEALPEVIVAGWSRSVPPRMFGPNGSIVVEGRKLPEPEPEEVHAGNWVSPGYFRAVGATLLEGRTFSEAEITDRAQVVILNQAAARRYWPDGGAVSSRISLHSAMGASPWMTVVGVVADTKAWWLGDRPDRLQIYVPVTHPTPPGGFLLVRSEEDPTRVIPKIRELLAQADPLLPIRETLVVKDAFRQSVGRWRFHALLLTTFSAVGVLLSVLGVYGVLSLSTIRRRREIGVRLALGATHGDIDRVVVGQGMKAVAVGLALGLVISLLLSDFIADLLWGVAPTDAASYVSSVGLLAVVGLVASYLPTRSAATVDPAETLRSE
jgi:predicted permease